MGEFEDEIVSPSADSEPVEPKPELDAGAVEDAIAEEPEVTQAPTGGIQDQFELDQTAVDEVTHGDDEAETGLAETVADEPPSDEDLAAAVEAASDQVAAEGTLDDIAPASVQVVPDGEIPADSSVRYGAPWWPFLIYLALWVVFAGVAVWQLEQLPATAVLYEARQYTLFVFGGLVLSAAGLLLIVAVWFSAWVTEKRQRTGLFSSAFIKGALVILVGVVVWWGTIMALDYLRLGRFI